jgi:hypothetical protein
MGSSDPLPAGFEIRFGSLNFQATGNGYLMRVTNRNKLHPRRSTGLGPVPIAPAADAQADTAGASAPQRQRRSSQRTRQAQTERRRAARVASQRDAVADETTTAPKGGGRAVSRLQFPLGLRGAAMVHASFASTDVAAQELSWPPYPSG